MSIGSSLGFEGELIWAGLGWTGEVLTLVQGLSCMVLTFQVRKVTVGVGWGGGEWPVGL